MNLQVANSRDRVLIGDIAAPGRNALVGGPFGSNLVSRDYVAHGVPVIRGQNMSCGRWVGADFVFVSYDKAEQLAANTARPGDLVFTQRGTLGQVALVPRVGYDRYIVSQSQMKLTVDARKADAMFLYYYFTSEEEQDYIRRNAIQAGVPHTNLDHLRNTPVLLPPLGEQRAIAHVLGTLDDKIEMNRRMNETLEAIARLLFKSWFVDFEPVRAKAEGLDPGLPKQIGDLFPDRLVDSELGEIPAGWNVGVLGDVAEHLRRGIEPREIEPSMPYIALEHMPRRSIALGEWGAAGGIASNKFEFKTCEILFGKLRPYFHKVGIAPLDGVCSTDIVVVAPKADKWFGFVLGHVSSAAFVEYTNAGSTGTKMPRTSWREMARYRVTLPPEYLTDVFTAQVRQMVNRIIASVHSSHTLAALRDALLPKLISGEVSVRDADRIMATADS